MNNYDEASAYMLEKIRENSSMSNPYTETEMKQLFLSQGIPEEWISHYLGGGQSNSSSQSAESVDPNANSPRLQLTDKQTAEYDELTNRARAIKSEEKENRQKRIQESKEALGIG